MLRLYKILIIIMIVGFILLVSNFIGDYKACYSPLSMKIDEVALLNSNLIIEQDEMSVKPVQYVGMVDFESFDNEERKVKFIQFMLPSIVVVRERLLDQLHHVVFIEDRINKKEPLSQEDFIFLRDLKNQYEAESTEELKIKLYPHPVSLVLAQAALESGWGTSRIFRKGNNPFGIMSFSSDDSRLKNLLPGNEEDIYMRSYDHVIEAVEHYYMLIAKVSSYKKFRQRRWEGAPSVELLNYLKSYHENDDYHNLAESIIRSNDLTKYDLASIDQRYIKSRSWFAVLMKN